ncbi:zinc finger protein 99 [Nasonia vitripennis]|uniref:C2H2-type domain-containing protein n=1 Tax=Nasonia vitripennis TaxID=7425 RepID=A0A7M7QKQ9_NASVI|nr:zinc finger protein 99 [Nasonia vitripennis]
MLLVLSLQVAFKSHVKLNIKLTCNITILTNARPHIPSLSIVRFYGYHRRLRSSESSFQLRSSNTTMGIPRRYLCADCGRMFGNRASLMRHRVYEGEGCQQQPPQRQQQQAEQAISSVKRVSVPTRSKRKHVCSKCNKSYAFFTSLWRHQNYECGVEPRFGCTVCRAKFAQKSNLDRHIRARHSS